MYNNTVFQLQYCYLFHFAITIKLWPHQLAPMIAQSGSFYRKLQFCYTYLEIKGKIESFNPVFRCGNGNEGWIFC